MPTDNRQSSGDTADRIADDLAIAAQVTQSANDSKLAKTGKASGWLAFASAIASIFGKRNR